MLHLDPEIFFKTSRSSGKGGQNVNKVSTKVELNFDVTGSKLLTDGQKQIILEKLSGKINSEGILKIVVQETRSQLENKQIALEKFRGMISSAFQKKKKRIRTGVSKLAKENRLNKKKKHSELKKGRAQKWF
ncbi:MAG TPA: alternative ribosome rescue aminoacyl-tRNA hydrolase ArfB [Bacteroidia bacterium]